MKTLEIGMPAFLGLSMICLAGCGGNFQASSKAGQGAMAVSNFNVNKYAVNKLVCNPFDSQSSSEGDVTTLDGGLQASLFYLRPDQPRYTNVSDMITHGVASDKNIFFTNINVPTRLFHSGFPLESGGIVKTDQGDDLFEYFALRMTGSLGLAPDEEEGLYELALLSDDGAIWTHTGDGENSVLVNNDGDHPTRFGCGQVVNMTRQTRIPSRIDYYQGPRFHISLVPMWRKVGAGPVALDPLCGKLGNHMYFDPDKGSIQQQAYKDLLSRGWKALRAENWRLPDDSDHNPCYDQGETPHISNLSLDMGSEGDLLVSWDTNIPATSQVLAKNTTKETELLTLSDNVLRTRHSVQLTGLGVGDFYEIQAISVSATLGRTVSPAVRVIAQ